MTPEAMRMAAQLILHDERLPEAFREELARWLRGTSLAIEVAPQLAKVHARKVAQAYLDEYTELPDPTWGELWRFLGWTP